MVLLVIRKIPVNHASFFGRRFHSHSRPPPAERRDERCGACGGDRPFGVALLATVLTSRLAYYGGGLEPGANTAATFDAFDDAFIVASAITVIGMVAAFFVSDREAAPSMRQVTAPPAAEEVEERVPVAAGR